MAASGVVGPVRVDQYAERRAFEVIELARPQRPEKCRETRQAKRQRDRNENDQAVHRAARRSLRALATTMIEEVDIAIAAISGVTFPMIASGTASTL